jgi:hypothetical protein
VTSKKGCEFLKDGNCLSIMTNDEAREERLIGCSNGNIRACCSLCSRLQGCDISCKLEVNRNEEDLPIDDGSENKKIQTLTCSLCNVEMLNSRMNLKVETANKRVPLAMGKIDEISEELLPVVIYLCPNCGKMEFMAQQKTKQRIINEG